MNQPYRIVCIGGGTGLPQLLTGFKQLSQEAAYADRVKLDRLTAVVTAFDDGGSSGRLVESYGSLPPGDLRNCLLALADERAEPLLTHFFNHRFREDEDEALAGHSAGNLLLLTLAQVYGGDVRKALLSIRRILPIRSEILFSTLSPAMLCAELTDGTVIRGESRIAGREVRDPIQRIFLEHRDDDAGGFPPMEGVLEAISEADLITIGPGSLFTSVLPHFLVEGVADALRQAKGIKAYVCNLMIESGETDGFRVSDHVRTVERLSGVTLDVVVANHAPVPPGLRRAYERARLKSELKKTLHSIERAFEKGLEVASEAWRLKMEAQQAIPGLARLAEQLAHPESTFVQVLPRERETLPPHVKLVTADLLAHAEVEEKGGTKRVIRHDPLALARTLVEVVPGEWLARPTG